MPPPKNTDLQRLYSRPGFLLRRAHQISAAIFERECEEIGLTPAQYSVLSVLSGQEGVDQTRLAKLLGFDKVTIVRVLHLMEDRKLVERMRLDTDRRANSLRLTDAGRALYKQAQKPVERAYQRLLEPFTKTQQRELVELLDRLITKLDAHARAPLVRGPAEVDTASSTGRTVTRTPARKAAPRAKPAASARRASGTVARRRASV